MGHTLLCKTIKSDTIKGYLKAAANYITAARKLLPNNDTSRPLWLDPRLDMALGTTAEDISNVTNEVKRWEMMPNRREPLTVDMIQHAALDRNDSTPHDIKNAMYDWCTIGIYIGPRLTEWAQADDGRITMNNFGDPAAFMWNDIEFMGENSRRMTTAEALANPSLLHTARMTWRHQKNGQNGEKRTLVRAFTDDTLCPVLALTRVMKRFQALGADKDTTPLAVFSDNGSENGSAQFIRARHIKQFLQTTAKAVYNIKKPEDLARFTSHSLRVGACVALHSAGISELNIKHALRWRSDSFMEYLRDVPRRAQQNSCAVLNFSPTRLDIIPSDLVSAAAMA